MTKHIDYFFAPGSPWALLGHDAFFELARQYDATVTPYPISIIAENGAISLKNRPEPRRRYWLLDLKRWGKYRNIPLQVDNRPTLSDPSPAARTIIAAHLAGLDWPSLTKALQLALWQRAEDIGLPDVRRQIADAVGLDGASLVQREEDEDVKAGYQSNLTLAASTGIFGSPTYVVDGQPYWGQDSLPFLERHLQGHPLFEE